MGNRSNSNQHRKVEQARAMVDQALGDVVEQDAVLDGMIDQLGGKAGRL
jgi:hypothetical protein